MTWLRSTSVPSTVTLPGWVSLLPRATSTKSACSWAAIRVVSEFQDRMSNFGGCLPCR